MDKQICIMNNTLTLIDELGLEQVSMRKIAEHCEIPLSSLYTYYKSKNDLLDAMFEYSIKMTSKNIEVKEESLEEHIVEMCNFFIDQKLFFRYIAKYFKSSFVTEETRKEFRSSMLKRKEEINQNISHLLRDDIDFETVDFLFQALMKEIVMRDVTDKKFIKKLIDLMVNGIAKERNVN